MSLSSPECIQQLTSLGLVSAEEIEAVFAALADEPRARSAEHLVRELVRQEKLTAYQAREVLQGRAKGLLLGNYVVLDELGKGGMGEVFKAQHRVMDRIVALKVVSEGLAQSAQAPQRFQREVRAAAKLTHPNVVAAYDAAEFEGVHYLVMEYVDGHDLSWLVKQQGPLPLGQAVDCILQAARGLEYAHQQNIVHRDIKPSNLLLDRNGVVKILDMGLARITSDTDAGPVLAHDAELTSSGIILGTIDYMAPEQAKDTKHADQRADVYSLGASLHYLLTGRPVYSGETLVAKLVAHQTQAIPALQESVPDASPALDAVFRKMVAKLPEERYQSMSEVVAALEACQTPDGGAAPLPPAASQDAQLSDFLRNFNPQTTAKSKVQASKPPSSKVSVPPLASTQAPSGAKTPPPMIAVAAPAIAATDMTIAADSTTQPTIPSVSPQPLPSSRSGPHHKPSHTAHRKVPRTKKPLIFIASLAAVAILVLAVLLVVVFRGGRGGQQGTDDSPGERGSPPLAKAPFTANEAKAHQAAWAKYLGVPAQFTNSLGIDFTLIPPGECEMGLSQADVDRHRNEFEPRVPTVTDCQRHRVRLTKAFYMATVEVSQSAYQQVQGANPSHFGANGPGKEWTAGLDTNRLPAESLTPADAEEFCRLLSELKDEAGRARRYRLPTEAEWEYACRGGTETLFWTGDRRASLQGAANLADQALTQKGSRSLPVEAWNDTFAGTAPVASFQPNPFGLYDMHGNVAEWCADWYAADYYQHAPVDNPPGPSFGKARVARGGGWDAGSDRAFSAFRLESAGEPSSRVGFRIVCDVERSRKTTPAKPQRTKPRTTRAPAAKSWLPAWKLPPGAPPPAIAPFDADQARQHQEAWSEFLKTDVEQTNSLGMKLRLLPPGDCELGATFEDLDAVRVEVQQNYPQFVSLLDSYLAKPVPRQTVRIGQPLTMSECEVTIGQFRQFVEATGYQTTALATGAACSLGYYLPDSVTVSRPRVPWHTPHSGTVDADEPVVFITPADALAFCDWLSTQENAVYRLPTEAEWEYAYRAGLNLRYGFFERPEDAAKFAWVDGGPPHPPEQWLHHASPVGRKQPNPFGFFDLAGNVAELCDAGTAALVCSRGGNFKNPAVLDVFSRREGAGEGTPALYLGFRVVRDLPFELEQVPADPAEAERWLADWLTRRGAQVTLAPAGTAPSDPSSDAAPEAAFQIEALVIGAAVELQPAEYAYFQQLRGLRSLHVVGSHFNDRAAAHLSGLDTIEDLKLENVALSPAGWQHLGKLPNVRSLSLTPPVYTDEILAGCAGWSKLEALDLSAQRISDRGLRHLADLQQLRRLSLAQTAVTDRGLEHLQKLKALSELVLAETNVTDAGLANLAGLESLTSLDLNHTPVSGQGLAALQNLSRLSYLNLDGAEVTDEGCAGIGQLIRLQTLRLSDTNVSDAGLVHLRPLRDLNELALRATAITDAGLAPLNDLRHLRSLILVHTPISGNGLAQLRDLLGLETLDLMWTRVGDEALPTLGGFPRLSTLSLHGTRLRGNGLEHLARLEALKILKLTMTDVPPEQAEALRRQLPNCQLTHDQTPSRQWNAAHLATWHGGASFATLQREGAVPDIVTGSDWMRNYPREPLQVVELNAADCPLGNSLLSDVEFLPEVRYLNLRNARLTSDGLSQLGGLKKLQTLILDQNRIDDAGLKHLEGLERLDALSLLGTRVTVAGVQTLLDKLPRCRVRADFPVARPGGPLIAEAYVGRPAPLAGLRSWTLAWNGFRQQPTSVACNPQDDLLAAAGDGIWSLERGWCGPAIRVWALNDEPRPGFTATAGNRQKILFGHEAPIRDVAWSPNGRYLASTGDDRTLRFWNATEGRCLRSFCLPTFGKALAWSPAGDRIVVACEDSLAVLTIAKGTFRRINLSGATGVDWAADGTRFLAAVDKSIRVYDAERLVLDRVITTTELPLNAAAWSPDGKQIAAAYDGRLVRVWDVETCELVEQFEGKAGEIAAVAWSPQGDRLATVGSVLGVWDAAQGERVAAAGLASGGVMLADWARTGSQIAVCTPTAIELYDAAKGTLAQRYGELPPLGNARAVLSPDGRRLFLGQGNVAVVRDADTGAELARWDGLALEKAGLAWSPAGDWIAVVDAARPGNLTFVDTESGNTKQLPNTQTLTARCFAWNHDGSLFATGDDRQAQIRDTASGEIRQEFVHEAALRKIAWSPDAQWFATLGSDQRIKLWNLASGQLQWSVGPLAAPFSSDFAWTPDSSELTAALETGDVYRIDVAAGTVASWAFRLRRSDMADLQRIATLAWSPDGKCLLTSGYSEAALWWPETGELRWLDRMSDQTVWLPDARRLFRGTHQGYFKTGHDAATGERLGSLLPRIGDDQWLVVGPEGHYRGSEQIEDSLLYAVLSDAGQQASCAPAEFAAKFAWKNDPARARLLGSEPPAGGAAR